MCKLFRRSGFELIITFWRDLATGLQKEIPMQQRGTSHIQVVSNQPAQLTEHYQSYQYYEILLNITNIT